MHCRSKKKDKKQAQRNKYKNLHLVKSHEGPLTQLFIFIQFVRLRNNTKHRDALKN